MPAELLSTLKSKFVGYLDASATGDEDFALALNEVMPRLYHMGFWRDMMTTLTEEDVSKGVWIFPADNPTTGVGYDSIISAILDDNPAPLYSMWHDYRRFGEPPETATSTYKSHMGGFIDDGYSATTDPYADDAPISPPRRQFRVSPVDSDTKATLLLRRKWVHVAGETDSAYLPNDNSILKHALLGKLGEDNADVERAEYHWQTAQRLLEADLDSYRGGAKPVLQISPNGAGGTIKGMY